MANSPIKAANGESDVILPGEPTLDFDDDTLIAITQVYLNEGNDEHRRKDFSRAIYLYTEGIKVNCKDETLMAKLFSNRAAAHFHLGCYPESLSDAKAAHELQPNFVKTIERGASACFKLSLFEEAITWCDRGLTIDQNNQKLVDLRSESVIKQRKIQGRHVVGESMKDESDTQTTIPTVSSSFQQAPEISKKSKDQESEAYGDLGDIFYSLGDFNKAIYYYNLCVTIAKDEGNKTIEGALYCNLGNAYAGLDDFKKAIDYHNLSLNIAKEVGYKAGEGAAYGNLGNAFSSLGNFRKAKDYHSLDLIIAKELGDRAGERDAHGNLGIAYSNLGDFEKARDHYNERLGIAKDLGDTSGESDACANLGIALCRLGHFKAAIEYFNRHLGIAKDVGDKTGEGAAYSNLGSAFYNLSDFRTAIHYHNLHLTVAKDLKDKAQEGRAYRNIGNDFYNLGDFKQAKDYHNRHLSIAKEVGDRAGERTAYCNLGNAFYSVGDFKEAIDYHNLALNISKEVGDKAGEGAAYGNLGIAFDCLGDLEKAVEHHSLHLSIAKELGDKKGEGTAYGNLGIAFGRLGDVAKALDNHNLQLMAAKDLGDKPGQQNAYTNLGNSHQSLGNFQKAIEYHNLVLDMAKEAGDRAGENRAYVGLSNALQRLGDFKKAIEYLNLSLSISKDLGDKPGEGAAYCNLGNAFSSIGDFKTAIDYLKRHISLANDIGDKVGQGAANGNLGIALTNLGDYEEASDYLNRQLTLAKDVGYKGEEGTACGSLGNVYFKLGDFNQAIHYHNLQRNIAEEVGDKVMLAVAYSSLGNDFRGLDDFKSAMEHYNLSLGIAKEVNDEFLEGRVHHALGYSFELLGRFPEALKHYQTSVRLVNNVRSLLQSRDRWKISFRQVCDISYTSLWRVLLKQDRMAEALFAAEKGRAQALTDLMRSQYRMATSPSTACENEEDDGDMLNYIPSSTIFKAVGDGTIHLWVLLEERKIHSRKKKLKDLFALDDSNAYLSSLIKTAHRNIGVGEVSADSSSGQDSSLSTLYKTLIKPIEDLVRGDELIIVPDGPLWLAPYAALLDSDSKYLCESFRIRLIPSLTSMKMITDCSSEYHSRRGALLVGDPWVEEVTNRKGKKLLKQLQFAKQEVEMIGQILNIKPLTGKEATKSEVLKGLSSVALVHFAAHGRIETGEIALTPDPKRASRIPTKEDYILTIADVLSVQMRARLVVLSCCHSGQGEIKAEGVVGIARAFMGAGARSVLVSLWAIDDEATLEFMRSFYHHLVEGRSASESLNLAMKSLRESDKYSDVKYWAPFVLVGDDVTLEFDEKE